MLFALLSSLIAARCASGPPKPLKFIAITDTHITTGADVGRLRDFLNTISTRDAKFVVVLGDIAGHQPEYLPGVKNVAEHAGIPVYLLPGNHDDNYAHNTRWWTSVFPSPYYMFSRDGYHFIMNWSQDRDAPLPWLQAALDSIPSGEPIVFCQHFPPSFSGAPDEGPWPILAGRQDDLVAAFSGHRHIRGSDTVGTMRSETLAACTMDSTRDGYFYEITLNGKKIERIDEYSFSDLVLETPQNASPTVTLENDSAYYVLNQPVEIHGMATDDNGVEEVQWQIDSGLWQDAEGDRQWSLVLEPEMLGPGHHLLRVRCLDDEGVYSLEFAAATLYVPEKWGTGTVVLSQGRSSYKGCRDITVKRQDPQANFANDDLDCWVYGTDGSREFNETYIRFALDNVRPSPSAKVAGVRLEMFCCRQNKLSYESGSNLYRVGLAGEHWVEDMVFDTRPSGPGWLPSSDGPVGVDTDEWPVPADVQEIRPEVKVEVDLNAYISQVEQWLDNPGDNLGWVISPVRENYNISFRSSEWPIVSQRPRLVIDFD